MYVFGSDLDVIHEKIGEIDGGGHVFGEFHVVVDNEADMMGARLKVNDRGQCAWMFTWSTISILLAESCGERRK